MNWLSQIKESPHYERLKNSVQYKYDRRQSILFLVITVIFGLVIFLPAIFAETEPEATFGLLVLFFLIILGMWVYYTYRWLEIFLYMDDHLFFQAKLDQPHLETYRYSSRVRFTVEFTDRQGRQQKRDTGAIFSSDWEPTLEEYNNKEVLLAYNEKTDRLIVICTV